MRIEIPDKLTPLTRAFAEAGAEAYAVGGLVRNALLGLPPTDIDICSRLQPDEVTALCGRAGLSSFDQGARYGTVAILLGDGEKVEHTTFRRDSYAPGGAHRPAAVCFGEEPAADAFRRDFSINALYARLETGEVLDPTGGLDDLKRGRLRTTSADADDILGSDALRVLRLVRFAAEFGFEMEEGTWAAAKRHVKKLADISAERIREELDKILLADARYGRGDVLTALERLDEMRAFDVFWPELAQGRGHGQRADVHRYEVLEHSLHVCAHMPPVLPLRLAGLLHDVGKPKSKAETGKYYMHDRMGEAMARDMLRRLKYDNATTARVCALVGRHMYGIQGTIKENTLRAAFGEWGRTGTEDMIAMREADVRGCGYEPDYVAGRWRALYEVMRADGSPFSLAELAVGGADALAAGIAAGPAVGELLERLRQHCLRFPKDNTRERLMRLIRNAAQAH